MPLHEQNDFTYSVVIHKPSINEIVSGVFDILIGCLDIRI